MNMKNPVVGVWGNALLLVLNNFVPPFFPLAGWWNQHALSVLPHFLAAPMVANFEQGFQVLPELPTEDWAGFGFGLSLLLLISVPASFLMGRSTKLNSEPGPLIPTKLCRWVLIAPWFALLAYGMKSGMVTPQRLIARTIRCCCRCCWPARGNRKSFAAAGGGPMVGGVLFLALVVLIVSPDRPLWPAKTILSKALARHPDQRSAARA